MKILFLQKKAKKNTKNEAPIYCRITLNGIRGNEFSTGVFCPVTHFDNKRQTIRNDDIGNSKLLQLKKKIDTIFIELENKGEYITPVLLGEYANGKKQLNVTLIALLTEYMKLRERLYNIGKISFGTFRTSRIRCNNIAEYLTNTKQRNILIGDVRPKFAEDFYHWMLEHKGAEAYTCKNLQTLSAAIDYAVKEEYIKYNCLKSCRFSRGEAKKIVYLMPNDVEQLQKYKFDNEALQRAADLFLLQCYTGFTFSDLGIFNPMLHIETDKYGDWISYGRFKTGRDADLPYTLKAKAIIKKYTNKKLLDNGGLKLPLISLTNYNKHLKSIAIALDFKINLTTHIGRKTFGCIALNDGYTIESVSHMMGHKSIKTTQEHYARILRRRIIAEVKICG